MNRLTRDGTGRPNPSRETKLSGVKKADREISTCPVQLTTCRIGNLTRLIHTLAICVTILLSFSGMCFVFIIIFLFVVLFCVMFLCFVLFSCSRWS